MELSKASKWNSHSGINMNGNMMTIVVIIAVISKNKRIGIKKNNLNTKPNVQIPNNFHDLSMYNLCVLVSKFQDCSSSVANRLVTSSSTMASMPKRTNSVMVSSLRFFFCWPKCKLIDRCRRKLGGTARSHVKVEHCMEHTRAYLALRPNRNH